MHFIAPKNKLNQFHAASRKGKLKKSSVKTFSDELETGGIAY